MRHGTRDTQFLVNTLHNPKKGHRISAARHSDGDARPGRNHLLGAEPCEKKLFEWTTLPHGDTGDVSAIAH